VYGGPRRRERELEERAGWNRRARDEFAFFRDWTLFSWPGDRVAPGGRECEATLFFMARTARRIGVLTRERERAPRTRETSEAVRCVIEGA